MKRPAVKRVPFILLCLPLLALQCAWAAGPQSGQFYKTRMHRGRITVADIRRDRGPARMIATAFQGLVNQDTAQCYLYLADHHVRQLDDTKRPFDLLPLGEGEDPGLRSDGCGTSTSGVPRRIGRGTWPSCWPHSTRACPSPRSSMPG